LKKNPAGLSRKISFLPQSQGHSMGEGNKEEVSADTAYFLVTFQALSESILATRVEHSKNETPVLESLSVMGVKINRG